jgi:hypothetical protein
MRVGALVGLPDFVARKGPDNMSHVARVQYEQHPIINQSMLSMVEQFVEIASWIRHRHERLLPTFDRSSARAITRETSGIAAPESQSGYPRPSQGPDGL